MDGRGAQVYYYFVNYSLKSCYFFYFGGTKYSFPSKLHQQPVSLKLQITLHISVSPSNPARPRITFYLFSWMLNALTHYLFRDLGRWLCVYEMEWGRTKTQGLLLLHINGHPQTPPSSCQLGRKHRVTPSLLINNSNSQSDEASPVSNVGELRPSLLRQSHSASRWWGSLYDTP